MDNLILGKGGKIFIKKWIFEKKGEGKYKVIDFITKFKTEASILGCLHDEVELEEGFTVRDWFATVINFPLLQHLDWYFPSFIEEFVSCPNKGCKEMSSVCLEKMIEVTKWKESDKLEDTIECYIHIYGKSIAKNGSNWALDFHPLCEYIDIPMKLVKGVYCINDYNIPPNKSKKTKRYKTSYTLWDVIHSFIWEISFNGTPEERNKKAEELRETIKEVETTPKEQFKSLEELEEEWKEKT